MPRPARLAFVLSMLLLVACATGPEIRVDPTSNTAEARQLLARAAREGPVLVTWRGQPPLATEALLAAVERGVRGIAFTATAEGEARRRFAFDFAASDQSLCGEPAADREVIRAYRVKAAFCDGERAVALAGTDPMDDPERLIWRLVRRLAPDDYPQTYGFGLFGSRVGFGIGATFGF